MNNYRQKKFVPIPKHAFDLRAHREMAQAVNALLNNRMVIGSGDVGKIHNADGNTIFELPAQALPQDFVVVSDGGDYYNCYTFDGLNTGSQFIKVAKHQDLRCILPSADPAGGAWEQKTIRGVTYDYVYNAVAGVTDDGVDVVEYTRDVTGSDASSETDEITPCLNVGDIITAFKTSFTGPDTLVGVTWQALADGRAWAKKPS